MKINGRPAMSGTIVVGMDEKAEIALTQTVRAELVFNDTAPLDATFVKEATGMPRLIIDGAVDPLGVPFVIELDLENGGKLRVSMTVRVVGTPPASLRVIHYTVA